MYIYEHQILGLSGATVVVKEGDNIPSGNVNTIVFNGSDETVFIDGAVAYINGVAPPPNLAGSNLTDNIALYSGRLSQSNINYRAGDPAGDSVGYITNDSTFTLTSINAGQADAGVLTVKINNEIVAQIDLASNFVEGNRDTSQNMSDYDTNYGIHVLTNGVCNFLPTGTYNGLGNLQLLSVQPYSAQATYYQIFQARINITGILRQGYSGLILEHSVGGNTSIYNYFLDTDTGANPSVGVVEMTVNNASTQWLSGIKFYDQDASFDVDVAAIDYCANNVYRNVWIVNFTAMTSANMRSLDYDNVDMSGFSSPPDIGENGCTITDATFEINIDQYEYNARITANVEDPYGNNDSSQSPNYTYVIYSYDVRSTNLAEYFEDENWRHPSSNGTTWPSVNTSQWDSTMNLLTGNDGGLNYDGLEVNAANRDLRYPETNATTYSPVNTANYSSASGDCYYYRWFYSTSSNYNNVNITIPNGAQYEIMLRLPTQTEWSDINAAYIGGPLDTYGKGCQTGKNGDEYSLTFGGANTGNSGNGFWLRIKDNDSALNGISYMIITNWA